MSSPLPHAAPRALPSLIAPRTRRDLRCFAAELLGTFALVAIGPGAAMVAARTGAFGHLGVSLAFGVVVAVVVATTGHVSGAHINPAVTLGLWSVGRFPRRHVMPYIVAQCIGGVLASLLLAWLLGNVGNMGATIPTVSLGRAFVIEAAFTALLGFVIMAVATDDRATLLPAPQAIGATVFVGALVTGPFTGGSFNPVRSLAPALMSGNWTAHWLYWIAPVLGMILGMRLYDVLRPARVPMVELNANVDAVGIPAAIAGTSPGATSAA